MNDGDGRLGSLMVVGHQIGDQEFDCWPCADT